MIRGRFIQQIAGILTICCMYLCIEDVQAQFLDPMRLKVGTMATVASRDYQPLWLVSNRRSSVADQKADVSTYLTFSNKHAFKQINPRYSHLRTKRNYPEFSLSYGVSVFNNQHLQEVFLQEGYVKVNFNHWQLAAGRYKEIIGEVEPAKNYDIYGRELHYKEKGTAIGIDPQISSGSLGISGNALPIPKVSIGLIKYTDIPFSPPGWIQFKGHLSHGWMEKDAFVKNALFHERSFYLRFGRRSYNTFHVYGGMNQFIIWGGTHPERGPLWNDWKDLTKVMTPGNNLGFFDYGLTFMSRHYKFKAYTQVPFEGRSSISIFRIKDRLAGFILSDRKPSALLSSVTIELIHSTWQDNNPENVTRDNDFNFYNNERYQTGWSYAGKIIGTPLFFDRQRAVHYFGEDFSSKIAYDWNIANNRIKGIHLGGKGNLLSDLYYKTLLTWTKNYGNYYNGAFFVHGKNQWYFMQELIYQHKALKLNATVGWDVGELSNNIGALIGIEYDIAYRVNANKKYGKIRRRRARPNNSRFELNF